MAKRWSGLVSEMLYISLALMAASSAQATPSELPHSSVVLVWAAWCAPCREEITDFERLEAAARPRDTVVWAIDDDSRSRATLSSIPSTKLRYVSENLPVLYKRLGINGPVALPLSLMTDEKGRVCATIRGGANASKIEQATRSCRARP